MAKTHKIKSMGDLVNAVTQDNYKDFLKDFGAWVELLVKEKGKISVKKIDGDLFFSQIDAGHFTWIDDGKHEAYRDFYSKDGKTKKRERIK